MLNDVGSLEKKQQAAKARARTMMEAKVKTERKKHLREANTILKRWLMTNMDNPYPTIDQKKTMMETTGLNRKQIDSWFKNARQRFMCSKRQEILPNANYSRYPSSVTNTLIQWVKTKGTVNPSEADEENLLRQTKLTRLQLRRWFANARRRGLLKRVVSKKKLNEATMNLQDAIKYNLLFTALARYDSFSRYVQFLLNQK